MKILLSAFSCTPGTGSESGIGWNWAVELAKAGHEVRLITEPSNRFAIDRAFAIEPIPNLEPVYYRLPDWANRLRTIPFGDWWYYLLWQIGLYRFAKRQVLELEPDVAHHITWGVFRHPSPLAFLGAPFIFGPLGGGESAPYALRSSFPWPAYLRELLRDAINRFVAFDPMLWLTFRRATVIFCKTARTKNLIPCRFHHKCFVQLELGCRQVYPPHGPALAGGADSVKTQRFLFVGRLLYWKGVHLAIAAFAVLKRKIVDATFTIVGSGKDESRFKTLAESLGVEAAIRWIPHVGREELLSIYQEHDIFIFPSLHDSSGNVVLEALSCALPIICLDLGGPAAIVDESCGFVIRVAKKSEADVVRDLAATMCQLSSDFDLLERLSRGALIRAGAFKFDRVVSNAYRTFQKKKRNPLPAASGYSD